MGPIKKSTMHYERMYSTYLGCWEGGPERGLEERERVKDIDGQVKESMSGSS